MNPAQALPALGAELGRNAGGMTLLVGMSDRGGRRCWLLSVVEGKAAAGSLMALQSASTPIAEALGAFVLV